MSEPKNDGGPAFPVEPTYNPDHSVWYHGKDGMSLRDWFAGQVLLGCTSDPTFVIRINAVTGDDADAGRAIMADSAYRMADAMLAARKDQP